MRAHTSDQDNEIVIRKSLRPIILRGGFPPWARNLFIPDRVINFSELSLYLRHVEIIAVDVATARKRLSLSEPLHSFSNTPASG